MRRLVILLSESIYDYRVMLAREERLGCCHDASLDGQYTWVNTSIGLSIWYFLVLLYLKPICIIFFKCICIIKGTLVVSDFVLA